MSEIKYKVKLNNGNECIGADEKTITAVEVVETAYAKDIAREIHHLNPLIPEQVTISVLDNFCDAAAQLMSMGYAVVLQSKGNAAIRIYPDVSIKGRNINLARAQEVDAEVTELTLENAGELASRVGVELRAKAECEPTMTKLLLSKGVTLHRKDIVNVPKVIRTGSTTPSGGDNTGGNTGGNGGGGNTGNGDDGMS